MLNENKKVGISSVDWRDGQQSLLATRIKTEDMLPILSKMDEVGFDCLEMWGGATFDTAVRYLREDPWERIRLFKAACPKTPLRMFSRGQNLVGYRQYSDDIVEKFTFAAARAGIDIFLIFDGLNDVRNTEVSIKAALAAGKAAEACIMYTVSPVHTLEKYIQIAKEYEAAGVSAIHIEDMAGIITPTEAYRMVSALKKEVSLPLHFHSHCTSGMAYMAYWEAIRAGADVIDCDMSALSMRTAHPPVESFVIALADTPRKTGMDLALLEEINAYMGEMRKKYKEFESEMQGVDTGVVRHQVPGGMLSNLEAQLKAMGLYEYKEAVLQEIYKVRCDYGYPPLATPFAQMVGAQAATNVITGQPYSMLSKESRDYLRELYGRPAGELKPELVALACRDGKSVTERPGSLLPPEWDKLKAEIGDLAQTDEDVLTYALFPEEAREFLKIKYGK